MDLVLDPLEKGFDSIGLMRGANAPFMRFAFVGAVSGLALNVTKPQYFYEGDVPRPWTLAVGKNYSGSVKPTLVPWWAVPVGLGVVSGMFV